jgi:hypothetical protein
MTRTLIAILTIALATAAARADVYFTAVTGFFDTLNDASGTPIADGTWAVVIDTNNNGPVQASPTNWLGDTSDYLVGRGQITGGVSNPDCDVNITVTDGNPAHVIPGYTAGVDQVYFMWFDKAYSSGATGPGANTHYGVEYLGVVPGDGGSFTPFVNGGIANQVTTPEPASISLLALALGAIVARRRNRKA